MKGSERRAERNKEKILVAALELFKSHGLKKVTINEVAQKAGITPATVYNRFGDKETLIRETILYWYEKAITDYKKVLETGSSFEEKLQNLISFKTEAAANMHGEFSAFIASDDPVIRNYLGTAYMEDIIPIINRFFDEGRQQGYVDPNLKTETIIRYTELIRRGLGAEAEAQSDPEYTKKIVQELTPLVLYGILGKQQQ